MNYIEGLKINIQKYLVEVNSILTQSTNTKISILNQTNSYTFTNKGKQIRPCLLLLSAANFGKINKKCIIAAAALEMIHIASLLHDDVVDDSNIRRSKTSAKEIWGNKIAVLTGDYMVAKAFFYINQLKNNHISNMITECATQMSMGELMQLSYSFKTLLMKDYYKIINFKTCGLISSAMQIGAILNGASNADIKLMDKAARKVGLAFQVVDDVLDYDMSKDTGKPFGQDLKQKKLTFPAAVLIKKANKKDIVLFRDIMEIENLQKNQISEVYNLMVKYDCFKAAIDFAQKNANEAKLIMKKIKIKKGLADLLYFTDFLVNRQI